MVTCGSHVFEFGASEDMKKGIDTEQICLTLIVKKLIISVEQGRW